MWHFRRRLVLALVTLVAGCAGEIVPPQTLLQPIPVAVLDHGRHTSIVIGADDGSMTRYAYGDWTWYALGGQGPTEASIAALVPSKAGLGRKSLPGPVTPEAVGQQIQVGIEDAHFLTVERVRARALVDRLDGIFFTNIEDRVVNGSYGLEFVPHPEPYTLTHNSNSVVAGWLRELGAQVEGAPLWAAWTVDREE